MTRRKSAPVRRPLTKVEKSALRRMTREEAQSLGMGRDPDRAVATRLGVSKQFVSLLRRQHSIALPSMPLKYLTPERVQTLRHAGLGVEPDTEVAKRMGVTAATIRNARIRLRIPAARHAPPGLLENIQRDAARWIAKGVRGVQPLAVKVGVTPYRLLQSARTLGWTIPEDPRHPHGWNKRSPEATRRSRHGSRPAEERPRCLNPERVRALLAAGLGRRRDWEVAQRVGLYPGYVSALRRRLGIETPGARARRARLEDIAAKAQELIRKGEVGLAHLARRLRASRHRLCKSSRVLGWKIPVGQGGPKRKTREEFFAALQSSQTQAEAARKLGLRGGDRVFRDYLHYYGIDYRAEMRRRREMRRRST